MRSCRKYGVSFNSNMDVPTLLSQWALVPVAMMAEFTKLAINNKDVMATQPALVSVFNQIIQRFPSLLVPPVPAIPSIPPIPIQQQFEKYNALINAYPSLVAGYLAYLANPTLPPVNLVVDETISGVEFGAIDAAMTAALTIKTATSDLYTAEQTAVQATTVALNAMQEAAAVLTGQIQLISAQVLSQAATIAVETSVDTMEIARTALYTLIAAS